MPPETPAERGLAVVALGRFALATDDSALRGEALTLARTYVESLAKNLTGSPARPSRI